MAGAMLETPITLIGPGAPAAPSPRGRRAARRCRRPRPPCSAGHAGAAQPASARVRFHSRRTSRCALVGCLAAGCSHLRGELTVQPRPQRGAEPVGRAGLDRCRIGTGVVGHGWLRWPADRGSEAADGNGTPSSWPLTPVGTARYLVPGDGAWRPPADRGRPPRPAPRGGRPCRNSTSCSPSSASNHRRPVVVGRQHGLRRRSRGVRGPTAGPDRSWRRPPSTRARRSSRSTRCSPGGPRPSPIESSWTSCRRAGRSPARGHVSQGGKALRPVAGAAARARART